jgi:hypothetical protein
VRANASLKVQAELRRRAGPDSRDGPHAIDDDLADGTDAQNPRPRRSGSSGDHLAVGEPSVGNDTPRKSHNIKVVVIISQLREEDCRRLRPPRRADFVPCGRIVLPASMIAAMNVNVALAENIYALNE